MIVIMICIRLVDAFLLYLLPSVYIFIKDIYLFLSTFTSTEIPAGQDTGIVGSPQPSVANARLRLLFPP